MRVELHPVFDLHLYLHQFHNVDLPSRGYYQVRLSIRPQPSEFTAEFALDRTKQNASLNTDDPFPPAIVDGWAVSRTVEVVYTDETLLLDSAFIASVQLNRTDCNGAPVTLEVDVELLFTERDRPPKHSSFAPFTKRTLQLTLNFSRPFIAYRSLFFETAAISLASFVSLVSVLPRRRKNPPDPPLSPKLLRHHEGLCSTVLASTTALHTFILEHSNFLDSPLNIEALDVSDESANLRSALESSPSPWTVIELDAINLSDRLNRLFLQCLHLFANNEKLFEHLYVDFASTRKRALSEGFFYSERVSWWDPVLDASLPTPFDDVDEDPGPPPVIFELPVSNKNAWYEKVRKSNYMSFFPRHSLHCNQTDGDEKGTAVIFEERFVPVRSPRASFDAVNENTTNDATSHSHAVVNCRLSAGLSMNGSPTKNGHIKSIGRERQGGDEEETAEAGDVQKKNSLVRSPKKRTFGDFADYVLFVKERNALKEKLTEAGFDGFLYSEAQKKFDAAPVTRPFSLRSPPSDNKKLPAHLVVFVHGLEGSWEDLLSYRTQLQMVLPAANLQFLMSRTNQLTTWTDLYQLGANLLREVEEFIEGTAYRPQRISFVSHSMGGVIVRTALGRPEAAHLRPLLHTFLSLNTPHAGLMFNQRHAVWGLAVVQWWKQSKSLDQLSMKDSPRPRNTFLFKLSRNGVLGSFNNVLMVGTHADLFVPLHSAVIEPSRNSLRDSSAMGSIYRFVFHLFKQASCSEILHNMHADVARSEKATQLVKFTVFPHHSVFSSKTHKITGKAAHTSVVDDDTFIEKFVSVAARRYFE